MELSARRVKAPNSGSQQCSKSRVKPKKKGNFRALTGGIIFGLGWALAGACPGPIFALIGNGIYAIIIVLFGALLGAFVHGVISEKLPH